MTISNIPWRLESSEAEGGGSTVAVGSTNSSADGSRDEKGRDASPMEDSTWRHLELAFIWAAPCLRKVAIMG